MARTKELKEQPVLAALFAKAVATSAGRGGAVPELEVVQRDVRVEPGRLAAYDEVCGFTLRDTAPSTFLHVLTFPLQIALFADRSFPYPLPGSVHLTNRIAAHRPVRVGESLRLAVHATPARPHRKGAVVDVLGTAYVADELVWEGESSYLFRDQTVDGGGDPVEQLDLGEAADGPGGSWRLGGDLGRRYARVSGDVNPIHLSTWTAKALGFPRAIAHGMWGAARMLAQIENRLPPTYGFEVAFRKPVPLPSTVRFALAQRPDGGFGLALRDARKGTVQVAGRAGPLDFVIADENV